MKNIDEWHKIGDKLTSYLDICSCQRKLKSIVDNLYSIYEKEKLRNNYGTIPEYTGAEWLLLAMLDAHTDFISHGTNCEYPILNHENEFWKFIAEVKDSPYLEDN